jgi:hypothetical protein
MFQWNVVTDVLTVKGEGTVKNSRLFSGVFGVLLLVKGGVGGL